MTRSPISAGGEVNWNSPGQSSGLPGSMRTAPSWPKSGQGLPSLTSRAISRRSAVAVRIRSAHGPAAPAGPCHTATACEHVGRAVVGLDLRIVAPQLLPGPGVERHHGIERRAGDELVAGEDRRGLELRALQHIGGATLEVAGVVGPGRDQLVDVLRRDLVERGEAAAALIIAIIFRGAGSSGR